MRRESEALACYNAAFELSSKGNYGSNLGQAHFMDKTMSQDKRMLIQKLVNLQNVNGETQEMVNKVDPFLTSALNEVIGKFQLIKQSKDVITGKIMDDLNKTDNITSSTQATTASDLARLDELEQVMKSV